MSEKLPIVTLLRKSPMFQGLPDNLFELQDLKLDILHLEENQFLFKQGEACDSMYVLIEGELHIKVKQNILQQLAPLQCVGDISVLDNVSRSADAITSKPAKLIVIPKCTLEIWVDNSEILMQRMVAVATKRLRNEQLGEILPSLFGTNDKDLLKYITQQLRWKHLRSGDYLFTQGDEADSMYMLVSGRLQVIKHGKDKEIISDNVYAGEIVGEMAILSNKTRNASIRAQRDCDLVEIRQDILDRILLKSPQINRFFINEIIRKFNRGKPHYRDENNKNITLLPIQDNLDVSGFCEQLQQAISFYKPCQFINANKVDRLSGVQKFSSIKQHSAQSIKLDSWLDEYDHHAGINIYVGHYTPDAWTQRSLQRADTILLLADTSLGVVTHSSPVEDKLLNSNQAATIAEQILILLNDKDQQQPHPAKEWLKNRALTDHHHLRKNHQQDNQRLARFLTNNAIGLVMGGGGARGYAHFGVWLALKKAGIPIDMFGGTSMGASMAAKCVTGWSRENLIKFDSRTIAKAPFKQFTLPLISLLNSKILDALYMESFGELRIEDLWEKFFCISANLSRSEMMVHRDGKLWHALRASAALPGILTPRIHHQELLVDGGVMNNLPGDIMRRYCRYVIVSDVSTNKDFLCLEKDFPSPWKVLVHRYSPFKKPLEVPSIINILMRSITLSSAQKAKQVKAMADLYLNPPVDEYDMMDFTVLEQLIDIGIAYTDSVLAENDFFQKLACQCSTKVD